MSKLKALYYLVYSLSDYHTYAYWYRQRQINQKIKRYLTGNTKNLTSGQINALSNIDVLEPIPKSVQYFWTAKGVLFHGDIVTYYK